MDKAQPSRGPELRNIQPTALLNARLTAHYAAQVLATFGQHFVGAEPDDSHRAMGWDDDSGTLVSAGSHRSSGSRLLLATASLTLRLVQPGKTDDVTFELEGRTLGEAISWLKGQLRPDGEALDMPDYDLPDHPLAAGAVFPAPGPALRQLEGWFTHAYRALAELTTRRAVGSPIRIWPHHFDCAALIPVPSPPGGEGASADRSAEGQGEIGDDPAIGLGLSPGDQSYAQPYWYVSPWPYPDPSALPPLRTGRWHTEGWVGAILTGEALLARAAPGEEGVVANDFLNTAHDAAFEALRRG